MDRNLIIDVNLKETVIALLEDHRLVELNKEQNTERAFSLRDVYLGKVKKLIPTLNAAFVDIGDKKDAFVHYLDLGLNFKAFDYFAKQINPNRDFKTFFSTVEINNILEKEGKIENVLKPGQPIIVQIVKEPISTKGSRLTGEISIAGRNLVLLPFGDKISVSQKISSKEEKKRLERLLYSILPANYGAIIRTAAEGKNAAVLDAELRLLVRKWEESWPKMASRKMPQLLFKENSKTTTILRDLLNDTFTNIYVNDDEENYTAKQIRQIIKQALDKVARHYGYDYCEDSTRVLTIKVKDRGKSRIVHSCDFAIVNDCEDGRQQYIRYNKVQNNYTWEYQGDGFDGLPDKIEWLRENGLWQQVRDYYIEKKNCNDNPDKHSRSIFAETITEMCQKAGYYE